MLQARCQKTMKEGSYCQDPGGPHSKANCKRRGGSFKGTVLKKAFCAHRQAFLWEVACSSLSRHPNKSWQTEIEPETTDSCGHNRHRPRMHSSLRSPWAAITGHSSQQTDAPKSELSCLPEALQEAPRSPGTGNHHVR